MADLSNIDMTNVEEPTNSFEPIPNGQYKAMVENSEMKTTKAGTGKFLAVTFKILEGEFEGRLVFENMNLVNPNPKCVEIGKQALLGLQAATGKINPTDSAQMHLIPIIIVVKVVKTDYPNIGDMGNQIKGYKKIGVGSSAPTPETAPITTTSASTVTDDDVPF